MGCWTRTHCLQIFSYILASIIFTNGQYDMLNLGKKLKTHELEYGTVLSSIETGPREQLSSKKTLKQSGVLLAFAQSDEKVSSKKIPKESGVLLAFAESDENATVASDNGDGNYTDPLFTTKCTTNRAITVNQNDLPTEESSDVVTEDPNTETTDDPTEPTDDPTDPTEDPTDPTDDPTGLTEEPTDNTTDDPNDITNNEVDPTTEADDTEPPTTKAYEGPKKTHVPDHYVDDV